VPERPEPIIALDHFMETAKFTHETIFAFHRELVLLDRADDHTRRLLAEAGRIAAVELPSVASQATEIAHRWNDESVLDASAAKRTIAELASELGRIRPSLSEFHERQVQIARDFRERLQRAREA
jgi:hypothetical protein